MGWGQVLEGLICRSHQGFGVNPKNKEVMEEFKWSDLINHTYKKKKKKVREQQSCNAGQGLKRGLLQIVPERMGAEWEPKASRIWQVEPGLACSPEVPEVQRGRSTGTL